MRYLITAAALALCTSVWADSTVSSSVSSSVTNNVQSNVTSSVESTVGAGSATGGAGSVILDNQSTVTSSVDAGDTGAITSSIIGRTGSMCSAVYEGRRCEISCRAPEIAQCGKAPDAAEPACRCQ